MWQADVNGVAAQLYISLRQFVKKTYCTPVSVRVFISSGTSINKVEKQIFYVWFTLYMFKPFLFRLL